MNYLTDPEVTMPHSFHCGFIDLSQFFFMQETGIHQVLPKHKTMGEKPLHEGAGSCPAIELHTVALYPL